MTEEKKIFQSLTSKNICHIYELLHGSGFISFAATEDSMHKVEALVANINGIYFDQAAYKTNEEKAVAYLYFLIKDHPFTDGNKRTACLSFGIVCDLNQLTPNYKHFSLDELAIFVEKVQEQDHQLVIKAIANILFTI